MNFSHLEAVALSDQGRKRQRNEDAFVAMPDMGLYCIADGMGGVSGGDLASRYIQETVTKIFLTADEQAVASFLVRINLYEEAINSASCWIKRYAEGKGVKNMGSTVLALMFDQQDVHRALALHAGDSRLYRLRANALTQITRDHTVAAALGCSEQSKYSNHLTKAVGVGETTEQERTAVDVEANDLYLLCSDGLSRMVSDRQLAKTLRDGKGGDLNALGQELIQKANTAGGNDNITVVLIRVGALERLEVEQSPEPETKIPNAVCKATANDSRTTGPAPVPPVRLTVEPDTVEVAIANAPAETDAKISAQATQNPTAKTKKAFGFNTKKVTSLVAVGLVVGIAGVVSYNLKSKPDAIQVTSAPEVATTTPNEGREFSKPEKPGLSTPLPKPVAPEPSSINNLGGHENTVAPTQALAQVTPPAVDVPSKPATLSTPTVAAAITNPVEEPSSIAARDAARIKAEMERVKTQAVERERQKLQKEFIGEFAGAVRNTMQTGKWGELADKIQAFKLTKEALAGSDAYAQYDTWHRIWMAMKTDKEQAEYKSIIKLTKNQIENIQGWLNASSPGLKVEVLRDDEQRADRLCRELFEIQSAWKQVVTRYATRVKQEENEVWGDGAKRLYGLWKFSGAFQSPTASNEIIQAVGQISKNILRINDLMAVIRLPTPSTIDTHRKVYELLGDVQIKRLGVWQTIKSCMQVLHEPGPWDVVARTDQITAERLDAIRAETSLLIQSLVRPANQHEDAELWSCQTDFKVVSNLLESCSIIVQIPLAQSKTDRSK